MRPHVHVASSSFGSGVDGEVKSQTPFSVRPGKTITFSKGGVKMRNRHSTDSKNNVTLKKSGKKLSHFQSEQSGAYTKEKVSVHHSAAGVSEHSLSPPIGTFHPSTQVNNCFCLGCFSLPSTNVR